MEHFLCVFRLSTFTFCILVDLTGGDVNPNGFRVRIQRGGGAGVPDPPPMKITKI